MVNAEQPARQSPGSRPRAVRWHFSYEGDAVHLDSRQTIAVLAPPSDPVMGYAGQTGFWYELRNARDVTLYRAVAHNPIRFHVEVPARAHEHALRHHRVDQPRGTFTVLVPELAEATSLELWSSPLDPAHATEAARRIARFAI